MITFPLFLHRENTKMKRTDDFFIKSGFFCLLLNTKPTFKGPRHFITVRSKGAKCCLNQGDEHSNPSSRRSYIYRLALAGLETSALNSTRRMGGRISQVFGRSALRNHRQRGLQNRETNSMPVTLVLGDILLEDTPTGFAF